ncbi:MAG: CRISPR-associated RAMP protein Csx10 [Abditibacteriales bacterium]|nr:CRISPR-associated RAMP protein Csx10 [Abditibacteriales bacterium]MDW8367660.1 CRISPR-associated RAMP protein Csx10 [Abditibacteriales bacterium]
MPVLQVVITAKAPLVFSERRPGGQFRPSTPYVPGAVLRGALAQQMLDAGEQGSSDFEALFLASDAPLFRHAYPARKVQGENAGFVPSRPLPATAFSCKAESGFDKHGVFDSLIDRLCCEQLGVQVPYLPRCAQCGDRVEALSGFHVGKRSATAPTRLTTRVALNRRRKTAEEGLLYSPVVISEAAADGTPTTFVGNVAVNDANRSIVERRLRELTHIGSGAARGFGWVEVDVYEDKAAEDLNQRVTDFNDKVRERWALWAKLPHKNEKTAYTPDNGTFFAVLLMSDAMLRANGWTPTLRLEPTMLGDALQDATLLRCYATADYRGGWNTGWGLPKDTELVAKMGSVYVYHAPYNLDDTTWLNALRDLEEQGVGEKRVEGYGQVRVCDEFHREIQEVKA